MQCTHVFHSTLLLLLRGRHRRVWTGLVGNRNVWCLDIVENVLRVPPTVFFGNWAHTFSGYGSAHVI